MIVKYDVEIDNEIVRDNLERICGQIFKLLPAYEEGKDCIKPLETLIIELLGLNKIVENQKDLFSLVCKLEGLKQSLQENIDFPLYRRTIFECCSLVEKVKSLCQ